MKAVNAVTLVGLGFVLAVVFGMQHDLIEMTPGHHTVHVVAGDENARQWLKDMASDK